MEAPIETREDQTKPDRTLWYVGGVGAGCLLLLCCIVVISVAAWRLVRQVPLSPGFATSTPFPAERVPTERIPTEPGAENTGTIGMGNTLGDPDAPVTMIVYSDFQCPYCERYWQETEPQIIANYVEAGQVYYVYRSLGAFIGPESQLAAEAAYCAGDQGMFWEYHDLLFENQAGENQGAFSSKNLLGFAESLGLDMGQFSICIERGKYTQQVDQDRVDGQNSGVQGTPSFLINGSLVEGALPYENFASVIDGQLAK